MDAFLAELKRRKVHTTALYYAMVGGGVWGAAEVAVPALGLPEAVITFIVVATLLGFPVALVLAWFFEVRAEEGAVPEVEVAEAPSAAGPEAATPAMRRRWGSVVGAATLVVAVAWLLTLMASPGSTPLAQGAGIVAADFLASEDDAGVAGALRQLVFQAFTESNHAWLVGDMAIGRVLARMERNRSLPLTPETAREIAIRDGYAAILEGEVTRAGAGWVVSARVTDAASGSTLASATETARSEEEVLEALQRLTDALRRGIGEPLASVEAGPPLWDVTTASLPALMAMDRGLRAIREGTRGARAALEEAVALDPDFAVAHMLLGVACWNAGCHERAAEAFTAAYDLRERVSWHERMRIEGNYHLFVSGDLAASRAAFLALRDRGTPDPYYLGQLANVADLARRHAEALDWLAEARRVQGYLHPGQESNLLASLLLVGRDIDVDTLLDATAARHGPESVAVDRFLVAWLRGDWQEVEDRLDGLLEAGAADEATLTTRRAQVRLTQGRLREGLEMLRVAGSLTGPNALYLAYLDLELGRDAAAVRARASRIAGAVRGGWPATADALLTTAGLLGVAGDPPAGRALLAHFDSLATDFDRRRLAASRPLAEGRILLGEGRVEEAIEALERAKAAPGFPFWCIGCPSMVLGRAYIAAGDSDRAIAELEEHRTRRYLYGPHREWNMVYLAGTLERLGTLHEAAGDTAAALARFGDLVELWADADEELQPRVRAARGAIARLGGPEGSGR